MARMICVDVDKRITFKEIQARCTPRAYYLIALLCCCLHV